MPGPEIEDFSRGFFEHAIEARSMMPVMEAWSAGHQSAA